jgi:hypothetical protein
MLNYIIGKEIKILPGELITHIKADSLHPVDEFLRPILPPTVTSTAKRLKYLKKKLEENRRLLPLEEGKIKTSSKPAFRLHDLEELQKRYASSNKLILNEMKTLLDNIENKTSWSDYELPENPILAQKDFDLLRSSYFRMEDVEVIKKATPELAPEKKESEPQTRKITPCTENYFRRNSGHWSIRYEGKEIENIDHIDGLHYISLLLNMPGTSISCKKLYQLVSGKTPDIIMSEDAAIAQGLKKGFEKQSIGTGKAREICLKEYKELQDKFPSANMEEQEEIKEKMAKLEPYLNLKERSFSDPNDKKVQMTIRNRLKYAYKVLSKNNMKELSHHLEKFISPDGDYSLVYNGAITWEIIFK